MNFIQKMSAQPQNSAVYIPKRARNQPYTFPKEPYIFIKKCILLMKKCARSHNANSKPHFEKYEQRSTKEHML